MISEVELGNILNNFTTNIRRKKIRGPYAIGKHTAELCRTIVSSMKPKYDTVQLLIDRCRHVAVEMSRTHPTTLVIGNIVRRVLYIVRDEYVRYTRAGKAAASAFGQQQDGQDDVGENGKSGETTPTGGVNATSSSAFFSKLISEKAQNDNNISHQPNLVSMLEMSSGTDFSKTVDMGAFDFKGTVIEGINDLMEELDWLHRNISEHAQEHIHANEIILTIGHSRTVEFFLKAAAEKKRKFDVIVAELAPSYKGHDMVHALVKAGIRATLISDAAVFAIMSRVNKVIVGTHAVMANGGMIAAAGTHMVALAAKEHKVPFVCVNGLYKLTPLFPLDQDSFNVRNNPSEIIPYENGTYLKDILVVNPAFDYVPPDLVDLYINNIGTYNPTYIYRLMADYYDTNDYRLEPEEVMAK